MIDFKQFCQDYNINYARNGKHARPGWVNISCPFCSGHIGFHGGFNIEKEYYNCHRCGSHSIPKIISTLTGLSFHATKKIIEKYTSESISSQPKTSKKNTPSKIIFPSDTGNLTKKARGYLINRQYDPNKLMQKWKILSTGHTGFYKHRILAPIYQNNILVSYQCRDITNNHPQKYLACNQDEEIIQHQHCIYGLDNASYRKCIIVEGITDVWRLGPGAIATFGISFTKQQAQLIAKNFDKVFIMFDGEPQAQEQAEELGFLISSAFNNPVEIINLPFIVNDIDPGELSQEDADALMKEIKLR